MLKLRRGQSVLEYAILMVIVIAALLAMQTYIKRGFSGRLKQAADDVGDQFVPDNYTFNKTTTTLSKVTETTNAGASTTGTDYSNTTTNTVTTMNMDQN